MSDVLNPSVPFWQDYVPKLFTVADLDKLPTELPSGPVLYELHHGRLITMPPPGDIHSAVETKIAGALLYLGEYKGHGKARCGDGSVILGRNPDHVLAPDAAFVSNSRLPLRRSAEGYL